MRVAQAVRCAAPVVQKMLLEFLANFVQFPSMWFPRNYSQSKANFIRQAQRQNFSRHSITVPGSGPLGEPLTIDIAAHRPKEAKKALVHLTGVHGIEGFVGSAVQNAIFAKLGQPPSDVALYMIHPVNPYGMSWLRRVNGNNVDLNRNYRTPDFHPPSNQNYNVWAPYLNPKTKAGIYASIATAFYAYFTLGHDKSLQAIAQGQYHDQDGLFFGGYETQPELILMEDWVRSELSGYEEVWALDVHSGLGKYAGDLMIVDLEDKNHYPRLQSVYGELDIPRSSEGSYISYGAFSGMIRRCLGADRLFYVMQEFGTLNEFIMGDRMRVENAYHNQIGVSVDHYSKRRLLQAFCPSEISWRKAVLQKGLDRFFQVLNHL